LSMKQVSSGPAPTPVDEIQSEGTHVPADVVAAISEVAEPEPPPLDEPEVEVVAAPAETEGGSEEDISLESIVEELKRREGRTE